MITDEDFLLIELDEEETKRYADDETFRSEVHKAARDLSDEHECMTVLIYDANGTQLDAISADDD